MDVAAGLQNAVFRLLADPATHGGKAVRRIDTHSASVFLTPERVYKVKRAVRFPFLDYSTLEKRKAACLAELDVNRNFAPELYRGVVPVTRESNGRLALQGKGEPVEWVVEMVRFDETQTLDCVADGVGVDDVTAGKLADAVASMHERAPVVDAEAWIGAVESYLSQNECAFREVPALFPVGASNELDRASRSAFARLKPLLMERGRMGLVRRGHGDLHLGNIVLLRGRPVPFDAIEFDPMIAAGDVLYDLAFLLMDLVERRLNRAANVILNGYVARMRTLSELDGLAALPFFMSLRAAIRAKVTASRIERADAAERSVMEASARTYFQLALTVLAPPEPKLIAIGGLSGTGKSVAARSLAPHIGPLPGAVVVRSDIERKKLHGVAETERLPPEAYRPEAAREVYRRLAQKAERVVAAGHSAIVDAVFARAEERKAIAAASGGRASFHGLFLEADLKTRTERVGGRADDASDADVSVARLQETFDLDDLDWVRIDAASSPAATLERVRDAIG